MVTVPRQELAAATSNMPLHLPIEQRNPSSAPCRSRLRLHIYTHLTLLVITIVMILASTIFSYDQQTALAANPGTGNACAWHTVHGGDTLSGIARSYDSTIWTLARVNHIRNVNLIFVGQRLCIPYSLRSGHPAISGGSGLMPNGAIRWYDYLALQWSTRPQVISMLRRAAAHYGLPANLLLAIAWQESGWYQHVIARDGGIGVMQLMPYTAMGINAGTGIRRDPYHLWDNINLGATLLRWLWSGFHGNLVKIISAYNEGGWSVIHRGIFNWHYVNNVLYLMRVFR